MTRIETYPNTPPPGYARIGAEVHRVNPRGGAIGDPTTLADAWRAHRELERELALAAAPAAARPALTQTFDAIARAREDDEPFTATLASGVEDESRRLRIVDWLCRNFRPAANPRGWSARTLGKLLEVSHWTLERAADPEAFRRALMVPPSDPGRGRRSEGVHRTTDLLERMVCAMASGPVLPKPVTVAPPVTPSALRMVDTAGVVSLVVRGPADTLARVTAWAMSQGATVEGNNVRAHLRGPLSLLRALRAAMLSLERWQTLTPTAADVDAWIGGESC